MTRPNSSVDASSRPRIPRFATVSSNVSAPERPHENVGESLVVLDHENAWRVRRRRRGRTPFGTAIVPRRVPPPYPIVFVPLAAVRIPADLADHENDVSAICEDRNVGAVVGICNGKRSMFVPRAEV